MHFVCSRFHLDIYIQYTFTAHKRQGPSFQEDVSFRATTELPIEYSVLLESYLNIMFSKGTNTLAVLKQLSGDWRSGIITLRCWNEPVLLFICNFITTITYIVTIYNLYGPSLVWRIIRCLCFAAINAMQRHAMLCFKKIRNRSLNPFICLSQHQLTDKKCTLLPIVCWITFNIKSTATFLAPRTVT